ncbi:MAG: site-2 protease family protein [bacterium]|nr:site-2 protease family protein [bacterium]
MSITFHEFSHAFIANKLGDPTAKYLGRITLNPLAHIDLFGTVILPFIMALTSIPLIGWAKPVPVNPINFKHLRRDLAIVSFAGPASNFILVILSYILIWVFTLVTRNVDAMENNGILVLSLALYFFPLINIFLMLFNLIPIPPLDGADILRHFLPLSAEEKFDRLFSNQIVNFILILVLANTVFGFIAGIIMAIFNAFVPSDFFYIVSEAMQRILNIT